MCIVTGHLSHASGFEQRPLEVQCDLGKVEPDMPLPSSLRHRILLIPVILHHGVMPIFALTAHSLSSTNNNNDVACLSTAVMTDCIQLPTSIGSKRRITRTASYDRGGITPQPNSTKP